MGKALGAIAGGVAQDAGIKSGIKSGRAGYGTAIQNLNQGKQEALGFLQPYGDVGQEAISPLSQLLLGKSYDPKTGEFIEVSPENRLSAFTASPDYQFRFQEGQKALESSQAARGGLLSGRALTEAQTYGQGQASSEYGNYLSRLMGLALMGQQASGQQANIASGVAGQIAGANVASAGLNMAGRVARGQNQADTFVTVGNQIDKIGQGMVGSGMMSPTAGTLFSDKKLKENIKEIGKSKSGIPIYHFSYINKKYGEGRFEGVMAQDLLELKPEAVLKEGEYLKVDYSNIDVKFRSI